MEATDKEIFDHATATEVPEQTQNEPDAPVEASPEARAERARDEKGKFVKADPEATSQEVTEEAPVEVAAKDEPQPEPDARIPSWRLKEEADAKREWQSRAEQAERDKQTFQQQLWQLQQQMQAAQPQPEPVDIFANPQEWEKSFEQRLMQKQRELEGNFSLRLAANKHGDKFQEAWKAMVEQTQTGNDSVRQSIINSPDPGEELVRWYGRHAVERELGDTDLETFLNKKKAEWMSDPKFQAQVIEAAKNGLQQSTPTNTTHLPPSLSKAASARSAHDDSISSGADLYSYATAKR